jgi:hypothetical protein
MCRLPCSDEDSPIEEKDEDKGYEECGTGGKDLVRYFLAHLNRKKNDNFSLIF